MISTRCHEGVSKNEEHRKSRFVRTRNDWKLK